MLFQQTKKKTNEEDNDYLCFILDNIYNKPNHMQLDQLMNAYHYMHFQDHVELV